MSKNVLSPVRISPKTIQEFSIFLRKKKRVDATINKYIADLRTFYNFLPEEIPAEENVDSAAESKILTELSLPTWRDYLISCGLAARTINTRIAACNNLLGYLKRKDWQVSPLSLVGEDTTPSITRQEYCKLLEAARNTDNERLYFMIKAFCCLGLSLVELPSLTVEGIVSGEILVDLKSKIKKIIIPKSLQEEFLNFAFRNGINSGSIFKSALGAPLTRTLVIGELTQLCAVAGVREEIGTPKKLQELYYNTYADLRSQAPLLIENEFAKIVEKEQIFVGWEQIAR